MFLIEHVNGMILHRLVHFEGRRTGFWYRLIFVVSLYGLYLYPNPEWQNRADRHDTIVGRTIRLLSLPYSTRYCSIRDYVRL